MSGLTLDQLVERLRLDPQRLQVILDSEEQRGHIVRDHACAYRLTPAGRRLFGHLPEIRRPLEQS